VPGFTVDFDFAAVIPQDALDDHQPETGAAGAGGVIGLEDAPDVFGIYPGAGVAETDGHETFRGCQADLENAAAGHGLDGVLDNVEECLAHLHAVGGGRRQIIGGVEMDNDIAVAYFRLHEFDRVLEEGTQIRGFEFGRGGAHRAQELGDDAVEPGDLIPGDAHEIFQALTFFRRQIVYFPPQKLEMDVEGIERVADFMRQTAAEQSDGAQALGFQLLVGAFPFAGDVAQDQDRPAFGAVNHAERDEVELQEAPPRIADFDLAAHDAGPFAFVELEQERPINAAEVVGDRVAGGVFRIEPDQFFGGAIGVGDAAVIVEHDDTFVDGVEDRLEQAALTRQAQEMGLETGRVQPVESFNQFVQKGAFHWSVPFGVRQNVTPAGIICTSAWIFQAGSVDFRNGGWWAERASEGGPERFFEGKSKECVIWRVEMRRMQTVRTKGTVDGRRPQAACGAEAGRGGVCRAGFTLIEILLVVFIVMIASALAVPSFMRAYQGLKLRTAARTVVMAGRYARGAAVLEQKQMALVFYLSSGEIEVVALEPEAGREAREMFLEGRRGGDLWGGKPEESDQSGGGPSYLVKSRLRRKLGEGVRIIGVQSEEGGQEYEGVYWVNYYSNGMSDKYSVELGDEHGRRLVISVDPLTGKARVEKT